MSRFFSRPEMTIMRRIVGPLVLLILIGNLIVVSLMLDSLDEQLLQKEQLSLQRQINQQAARLENELDRLVQSALFVAHTPPMQGLVRARDNSGYDQLEQSDEAAWKRRLVQIFQSMLSVNDELVQIRVIRPDGREYIRVDRYGPGRTVRLVPEDQLQNKFHRPYFQRALELKDGEVDVSEIEFNREYGKVVEPPEPVIRAGTPVLDASGEVFMVVVINRLMQRDLDEIRSVGGDEQTFTLTNHRGDYLVNRDAARAFAFEYGRRANILDDVPDASTLLDGTSTDFVGSVVDVRGGGAVNRVVAMRAIQFNPAVPNEYLIVAGQSSHEQATAIRRNLLGTVYLVVAIVGLLSSLIALAVAWRIAAPIIRMRDAVVRRGLETRDDELPLEVEGEVGELAQTFSQFLSELRKRQNRLEHEILQRKVALAHLEVKNDQLEFANKESEQFVYIASHDLQEPVRTVKSFVQLLGAEYADKLDANGRQILDFLDKSTTRMSELIKGLLDYSRLGRKGEAVPVNMQHVVDLICQDLTTRIKERNATVEYAGLPIVDGYPTELRALLQNLLTNALKFSRPDVPPVVRVSARRQGREWLFEVADNGIGIAEEHFEKIFLIFQRLHGRDGYEGSGIGLAHCKKIIEMHGGKIWLQSSPGEGTTFFFTLRDQGELPEHNDPGLNHD